MRLLCPCLCRGSREKVSPRFLIVVTRPRFFFRPLRGFVTATECILPRLASWAAFFRPSGLHELSRPAYYIGARFAGRTNKSAPSWRLIAADAEAEAGTDVDGERGISHYFVVAAIEGVLNVCVCGQAGVDGIPSAYVGADVAGGVVDVEAQEVGVGAASYETSREVPSPARAEIGEQDGSGVLGATQ